MRKEGEDRKHVSQLRIWVLDSWGPYILPTRTSTTVILRTVLTVTGDSFVGGRAVIRISTSEISRDILKYIIWPYAILNLNVAKHLFEGKSIFTVQRFY